MKDTKEVCRCCGSDDIRQEISFMVNPNTFKGELLSITFKEELLSITFKGELLSMEDANWEDYYYCNVCEDTCLVLEKPCDT